MYFSSMIIDKEEIRKKRKSWTTVKLTLKKSLSV
jgi:hypothetical protein